MGSAVIVNAVAKECTFPLNLLCLQFQNVYNTRNYWDFRHCPACIVIKTLYNTGRCTKYKLTVILNLPLPS
jgi:hypothetical protein